MKTNLPIAQDNARRPFLNQYGSDVIGHLSGYDRLRLDLSYYWSVSESEYATDMVFRDPATLARLYPQWIRHAITTFGCTDIMRYLGRRVPTQPGQVPGHFTGEVISA